MYFKQIILTIITVFLTIASYPQDSLNITHYNIHLNINTGQQTISGHTTLTITTGFSLDSISLYLWHLHIDSILVKNTRILNFMRTEQTLTLPYKLHSHDTIELSVYYHGHPQQDPFWGGFYFKQGYAFNYGIGMHSDPLSLGRSWFPTNDSFTDKALFDFYITTPRGQKAICSGLLVDSLVQGDAITWHWHLSEPIPPYLANVAVGRYKKFSWTYHGLTRNIPVQIYIFSSWPDSVINTFRHLNQVMKIYEKLFGPYQWERIGYVQTMMTGGAMEHATNISLPYYAINGTLDYEDLIYHELAHSWFGNLVTCSSPGDMWLNEGWAAYSESLYKQYLYGQEAFASSLRYNHIIVLNFSHKEDNGYRAVGNIPHDYTYGSTIYKKGADIVHNLRYQIGDSLFWPAVRHYLSSFAWGNASIQDLRRSLEQFTHMNLQDFFDYWIYSPGFPLLRITDYSVKKISKNHYQVIAGIDQQHIGTRKYLKGQRLQIAFVKDRKHFTVKQTFITGQKTIDTFDLAFSPQLIFLDPYDHLLDASTDEYYWIDTAGQYIFDYELCEITVNQVTTPSLLRVKANWSAPSHTLINNNRYLLNSTYYWTIQSSTTELNGTAKLYLSTLMDINFKRLNEKQIKGIRLFYRPDAHSPWTMIDARLSKTSDYLIIGSIRPGDYIIGYDRSYGKH